MTIEDKPELSIVIPVFDEEESLAPLYEKLTSALERLGRAYEVIFIDDGSRDKSLERLREIARKDPRVYVISFVRNFGKTPAWSAGIDYARGKIIISMDADLQNDPEDIPQLLSKMDEGFDVVSGWRRKRQDEFVKRLVPSWIANKIISAVTKVPIRDFGCGLKAYKCNVIKGIHLYGEMHRFAPIYATWLGARVTEIPVNHLARQFGVSKFSGLSRTYKVVLDLVTVQFMSSYFTKPIYVFGAAGLISSAFAILGIIAMFVLWAWKISVFYSPLPVLVCLFAVVAVQFVLMGLMAEILMRTYHESQGKLTYVISETINFRNSESDNL